MITFSTLRKVSIDNLLEVFNSAFSDYFVPMQLLKEQFQTKLNSDCFSPDFSVGAFSSGHLVGFLLLCYREVDGEKKTL